MECIGIFLLLLDILCTGTTAVSAVSDDNNDNCPPLYVNDSTVIPIGSPNCESFEFPGGTNNSVSRLLDRNSELLNELNTSFSLRGKVCSYHCAPQYEAASSSNSSRFSDTLYKGQYVSICENGAWFNLQRCIASTCNMSNYTDFGPCSAICGGGYQNRTRILLSNNDNSACHKLSLIDTRVCNTQSCPIDCMVTCFSEWSACDELCGNGTQFQSRSIIQFPSDGGEVCPTLHAERVCVESPCEMSNVAPRVKSIALSETGLSISINFNLPTNQPECTQLFDLPSIHKISFTQCFWKNSSQVIFTLHPKSTLLPGDLVSFNVSTLLIMNPTKTLPLIGKSSNIPVVAPIKPLSLHAVITGPEIGGMCGNLRWTGGLSGPSLGRPLNYTWRRLNFGGPTIVSTNNFLDINLNSTIPGALYLYQLTVQNWLGKTAIATKKLFIDPKHYISFQLSSESITTFVSNPISIKANLQFLAPICSGINISSLPFSRIQWYQMDGPDIITTIDSLSFHTSTLFIPPHSLIPSRNYIFEARTFIFNLEYIASVNITTISSPLHAIIDQGSDYIIFIDENSQIPARLSASQSYDPDLSSDFFPYPLLTTYQWNCFQESNEIIITKHPCLSAHLLSIQTTPILNILPTDWIYNPTLSNQVYITLHISKDNRTASTSIRLTIKKEKTLTVNIFSHVSLSMFNPSHILTLTGVITGERSKQQQSSLVLLWNCSSNNFDLTNVSLRNTELDKITLQLKPGVLQPGTTYQFSLMASIENLTSSGSVTITTLQSPTSGSCSSLTTGSAYFTPFTFACQDWTSSYYPLTYAFHLKSPWIILKGFSFANSISVLLPPGRLLIDAHIKDSLGTITTYTFSVNVNPFDIARNGGGAGVSKTIISSVITSALVAKDIDQVSQGVVMVSTLLDTYPGPSFLFTIPHRMTLLHILTHLKNWIPFSMINALQLLQNLAIITSNPSQLNSQSRFYSISLLKSIINNNTLDIITTDDLQASLPDLLASLILKITVNMGTSLNSDKNLSVINSMIIYNPTAKIYIEESRSYALLFKEITSLITKLLLFKTPLGTKKIITEGKFTSITAIRDLVLDWKTANFIHLNFSISFINSVAFNDIKERKLDGCFVICENIYSYVDLIHSDNILNNGSRRSPLDGTWYRPIKIMPNNNRSLQIFWFTFTNEFSQVLTINFTNNYKENYWSDFSVRRCTSSDTSGLIKVTFPHSNKSLYHNDYTNRPFETVRGHFYSYFNEQKEEWIPVLATCSHDSCLSNEIQDVSWCPYLSIFSLFWKWYYQCPTC